MKLHTSLPETEVRACLARQHAVGDIPADVEFDIFGLVGSRSHQHAYEIHLATAQRDTRNDGIKRKTSSMAGSSGLRYAATYDEWGWFLAEFFSADPDAKASPYKNQADFHAKTAYTYASGIGELPGDTAPADPEPYRDDPDTTPTTSAEVTLNRIEGELAIYRTWAPQHP